MITNDANTEGMYCPFHGFNPPCGCCMLAVQENSSSLACALAANAVSQVCNVYVKNIAKVVEHGN